MGGWVRIAAAALVLITSPSSRTFAQGASVPHGSLFGESGSGTARNKVDLTTSLAEAYDKDAPSEVQGVGGPETLVSGWSTMLDTTVNYHWSGTRVQAGGATSAAIRYFSQVDEVRNVSEAATLSLNGRLAERSRLQVDQTFLYSPSYFYDLFPSAPAPPGEVVVNPAPDYAVSDVASWTYGSTVTLTQGLGRRSHLSGVANWLSTNFSEDSAAQSDLKTRGVQMNYSQGVSRNAALSVAYHYRTGSFGLPVAPTANATSDTSEHRIDIGVNYVRPLSATRQFVFAARVGPSAVRREAIVPGGTGGDRIIRGSGDMALGYQFKTWQAHATFRRGLEYVAALGQPVFVNGATLEWTALPTARLDLSAGAQYSSGGSAHAEASLTTDTYSASARARYAATQELALYGEYIYYFYDLGGRALLDPTFPRRLDRNGVRFGLTLWVPVLRR